MNSVFEHRLIGNGVRLSLQDFCKRFGWVPCKQQTGSQCERSDAIRWRVHCHRPSRTFMAMRTVKLRLVENLVVARSFLLLLIHPGFCFSSRRELLDRDEVVLVSDIRKDMDRKVGCLPLVANGRIVPFLGWQWHLGGETRLPDASQGQVPRRHSGY